MSANDSTSFASFLLAQVMRFSNIMAMPKLVYLIFPLTSFTKDYTNVLSNPVTDLLGSLGLTTE